MTTPTYLDGDIYLEKEIKKIPHVSKLCVGGQRINIGDCNLYYEREFGTGDLDLVLLHGGPGGTHHYFHPSFSKATKLFKSIIYYDQRGCGESDYKKGFGYSITQAVNDLEALRKNLGINRWIVLGHSFGGLLAQCYALQFPQNLSSLILVNSMLGFPNSLGSRQKMYISEQEREKMKELNVAFENGEINEQTLIFNRHLNGDWKRQSYYKPSIERFARMALYEWRHDEEYRETIVEETRNIDLTDKFINFQVTTLVIEGDKDLTWGEGKAELFYKNHPNTKFVKMVKSGHAPFDDEPDLFFKTLKDFNSKF